MAEWRTHAEETMKQVPDWRQRFPLSTGLEPLTPDWQDNPRAALTGGVRLLAKALE